LEVLGGRQVVAIEIFITKFHNAIKYTPVKSFKTFSDEVSDARRAGNIDNVYEFIAETMKLF
jgi:hypothetical protein